MLTQQRTEADTGEQRGCRECGQIVAAGSRWCGPHLLGKAVAVAYNLRFPRVTLGDGTTLPAGDEAWLPWLREATPEDLTMVLEALPGRIRG